LRGGLRFRLGAGHPLLAPTPRRVRLVLPAAGAGRALRLRRPPLPRRAGPRRRRPRVEPGRRAHLPGLAPPRRHRAGPVGGPAAPAAAAAEEATPAAAEPTPTPSATATPGVAQPVAGYLKDAEFYSEALGRTMSYGIYLPPNYDRVPRRYPVLYMLHGIDAA